MPYHNYIDLLYHHYLYEQLLNILLTFIGRFLGVLDWRVFEYIIGYIYMYIYIYIGMIFYNVDDGLYFYGFYLWDGVLESYLLFAM